MHQILQIAAFWLVVIVAIRVGVCFPRTLFARILFFDLTPARMRDEAETSFRLRRARHHASWLGQAVVAFAASRLLVDAGATFVDSAPFLVMWTIVVPAIGACALAAVTYDVARYALLRIRARTQTTGPIDGAAT